MKLLLVLVAGFLLLCCSMAFADRYGAYDYGRGGGGRRGGGGYGGRGRGWRATRSTDENGDDQVTTQGYNRGGGGYGRPQRIGSENTGDDYNEGGAATSSTTTTTTTKTTTTKKRTTTRTTMADTTMTAMQTTPETASSGGRVKSSPPTNGYNSGSKPNARSLFGLSASPLETLEETNQVEQIDNCGSTMTRLNHNIGTYRVWGSGATVVNRNCGGVRGLVIASTSTKPKSEILSQYMQGLATTRSLPFQANSKVVCQNYKAAYFRGANITLANITRFVYSHGKNASDPKDVVYADVTMLKGIHENGTLLCWVCLVDTSAAEVIKSWGCIQQSWDGGNRKTGKYTYGTGGKPSLSDMLKTSGTSGQCQMANKDNSIRVVNMQNQGGQLSGYETGASVSCSSGPTDGNTRGYGPLADSFYNAKRAIDMFRDANFGRLTNMNQIVPQGGPLLFAIHYQSNYDNAYWDGSALYFGDGGQMFYPLGTCLDVVAHEIGHAITQESSGLIYTGEAGCLNEAFSDAVGELAEYYDTGSNDFCIAKNCMMTGNCLRDMTKPQQYSSYFPYPKGCSGGVDYCQDPHVCSAIVNYMFYKLATTSGWNTKKAALAFLSANRLFWQQETTIRQAGCDVASAVKQNTNIAGGDTLAVVNAWKAAGVDLSGCVSNPTSGSNNGGSGSSTSSTSSPTSTRASTTTTKTTTTTASTAGTTASNPIRINNCDSITGTSAKTGQQRHYIVYAPYGSNKQNVQIYGGNGDADLYVRAGNPPTLTTYDDCPYWTGSNEWVVKNISKSGVDYRIMIDGPVGYSNLEVYACFYRQ